MSNQFPDFHFDIVPDGQPNADGSRGLSGLTSLAEAATENDQREVYAYGATLPEDLKQQIIDEVMAMLPGSADEPVSISFTEWVQNPDWPFEPSTQAHFTMDLSPEVAARVKAAALGLDVPADETPEEPPAEEEVPEEEMPADGTATVEADGTATADPADPVAAFLAALTPA